MVSFYRTLSLSLLLSVFCEACSTLLKLDYVKAEAIYFSIASQNPTSVSTVSRNVAQPVRAVIDNGESHFVLIALIFTVPNTPQPADSYGFTKGLLYKWVNPSLEPLILTKACV